MIFFDIKAILLQLHKTDVPDFSLRLSNHTAAKAVDNVYNLVYNSLLSVFRVFLMWITILSIGFSFRQKITLFLSFVQYAQMSQVHAFFKRMQYFENSANLKILFRYEKSHTPFRIWLLLYFLENSSDCQDLSVVRLRNNNSCSLVGSMDNLPVSDVQSHMSGIADQISGLCILKTIHGIALTAIRC